MRAGVVRVSEAGAVAIIIAGAAVVFALCCASIARAAFSEQPSRASVQVAFYWGVAFTLALIGCLAATQLWGNASAALYSALFCVVSLAAGWQLAGAWKRSEEAELAAIRDLREFFEAYSQSEESVEERCSRAAREYDLTRREEAILVLLLEGKTRAEVAAELYVSDNTVKTHIRNLYRKMGVSGKTELAEAVGAPACR